MQFTLLEKLGAVLLLVLTLIGAEQAYEHHIYEKGVAAESSRRGKIDEAKKAAADKELARLNGLLADAKAKLAVARADLATQQKELENAKSRNTGLQSDLATGRRVLRALVRTPASICEARNPDGAAAGRLDHDTTIAAELDGTVAAGLAGLTGEGDAAIRRLNGCIASYDALKSAVNTASDHPPQER